MAPLARALNVGFHSTDDEWDSMQLAGLKAAVAPSLRSGFAIPGSFLLL
jgi:hypothetical protein